MRRTRVDMSTEVDLLTVKFLFPKIYLKPGSNYAKVFEKRFWIRPRCVCLHENGTRNTY